MTSSEPIFNFEEIHSLSFLISNALSPSPFQTDSAEIEDRCGGGEELRIPRRFTYHAVVIKLEEVEEDFQRDAEEQQEQVRNRQADKITKNM